MSACNATQPNTATKTAYVAAIPGAATKPDATFGIVVLCAAGGMGFGAFNEVVEFIATRIFPKTNVGDYENTGFDLVYNLIGATIAATVIYWRRRQPAPTAM